MVAHRTVPAMEEPAASELEGGSRQPQTQAASHHQEPAAGLRTPARRLRRRRGAAPTGAAAVASFLAAVFD
jgi:hypothetical protein